MGRFSGDICSATTYQALIMAFDINVRLHFALMHTAIIMRWNVIYY